MICPFCGENDDKVIDSRPTENGSVIRRRRQCLACGKRFSTYERIEQTNRLMVVKKDGSRVPFSAESIARGVANACGKRPIPEDLKRRLVEDIDESLHAEFEREVPSRVIGERVMAGLRRIDRVAYLRFASEHLALADIEDFKREIDELMNRPPEIRDQQALFGGGGGRLGTREAAPQGPGDGP